MSEWTLEQVDCKSGEWAGLLANNDHLIFHEPVWAPVMQHGLNGTPCCCIFRKDRAVAGGLIGFARNIFGMRMLFMNVPYGGVIGEAPPSDEFLRLLTEFASRLGIGRIRIVDPPGESHTPRDSFEVINGNSHILALNGRTYETIWTDFKKAIRRDVRIAERNGITVKEAADDKSLDAFYELYLESMRRNRAVPKYGREFIDSIYRHVVVNGKGAILLAIKNDVPIAGLIVVDSAGMTHYLMAGSQTGTLHYCPNDFLINAAIRRSVEKGIPLFDFMGTDGTDPNLERFKAKWGAEPREIVTLTLVTKPVLLAAWTFAYRMAQTPVGLKLMQWFRRRK